MHFRIVTENSRPRVQVQDQDYLGFYVQQSEVCSMIEAVMLEEHIIRANLFQKCEFHRTFTDDYEFEMSDQEFEIVNNHNT